MLHLFLVLFSSFIRVDISLPPRRVPGFFYERSVKFSYRFRFLLVPLVFVDAGVVVSFLRRNQKKNRQTKKKGDGVARFHSISAMTFRSTVSGYGAAKLRNNCLVTNHFTTVPMEEPVKKPLHSTGQTVLYFFSPPSYCVFTRVYRVFTGFYLVLLGCTGFYRVVTRFCGVLLGCVEFSSILLDFS